MHYIHLKLDTPIFYCLLNFQCAKYRNGISLVQKGHLKFYKA